MIRMEFSLTKKTLFNVSAIAILSLILLSGALAFSGNTFTSSAMTNTGNLPNAAGYEVTGAAGSLTRVKGSWVVPTISCSSGQNSQSNISVVLDGLSGSADGMYVGTYANCENGGATYGAYTYFFPTTHHGLTLLSMAIHPGDKIEAQGKWVSNSKASGFHSQVIDETTGCNSKPAPCVMKSSGRAPTGSKATLSKASFLVGMPTGASLADYNKVQLGADYTSVSASCVVSSTLGKDTSIGALALASGYNVITITQQDSSKLTMAAPTALSSDGYSFTVNWMRSS